MRPLAQISRLAEENELARLDVAAQQTKLPHEVESFVAAIGRLVERIQGLLEAQRAFVARAAHELRTPLTAMTLEAERPDGADRSRLQTDIAALRQIVDQLLILARLETKEVSKAEQLDLEFLAEEIIEQVAPIARNGDHEVMLRALQPTSVTGDVQAIQHSLRNLLRNACEHTPAGTRIVVTVGPGPSFCVADDGPGWGSYDSSQPIEPFKKGNAALGGTGLGLSIVKRAAEVLGGAVTLGTSETGGAKVVVDWRDARTETV
jgi:signal transduction histidine kinase